MSRDTAGGFDVFTVDVTALANTVEADSPIRAVPVRRRILIVSTPHFASHADDE
jgi:hypothetical protein